MLSKFKLLYWCTLFSAFSFAQQAKDSVLMKCRQLTAEKKYTEALQFMDRYTTNEKSYSDSLLYVRAQLNFFLDQYTEALKDAKNCIKKNPQYHAAHFLMGLIKSKSNNFSGAIRSFTKAIAIDSTQAKYYYDRGISFLSEEDIDDAIKDLSHAIQLKPDYTHAYYSRGYALDLIGKTNDAIEDHNKAIALDITYREPYLDLAAIYLKKNEPLKACDEIKRAQKNGCIISEDTIKKFCQ